MAERRLTHKDIKQPDQFVVLSVQAIEWIKSHTRLLLYGALGVAVLIGLGAGWSIWQSQRQQKAEALLYSALQQLKSGDKTADSPAAREQLQRLMREYSGTPAAASAAWQLGHIYFRHGEYADALAAYEQAQRWLPRGQELVTTSLLTLNIAYAQEAQGSYPRAIASFEEVVRSPADWLHGEAFLGIGRAYEKTGEAAKALATYERALGAATVTGTVRQQIEERQTALRSPWSSQSVAPASDAGAPASQGASAKP